MTLQPRSPTEKLRSPASSGPLTFVARRSQPGGLTAKYDRRQPRAPAIQRQSGHLTAATGLPMAPPSASFAPILV